MDRPHRGGRDAAQQDAARLVSSEPGAEVVLILDDGSARYGIGRLPTSAVCLSDDHGVSRRHAEISMMGGRWQVIDLRSRNGTYVQGELVRGSATLVHGAVIRCGSTELRFIEPDPTEHDHVPSTHGLTAWPPLTVKECAFLVAFTRPFMRLPESQLAGVRPPKNSELAVELGYSEPAIRKRLKDLYRKYQLTDLSNEARRSELALRARLHRDVLAWHRGDTCRIPEQPYRAEARSD